MARTAQEILEQTMGHLMTQNALLIERNEYLMERVAQLEEQTARENGREAKR